MPAGRFLALLLALAAAGFGYIGDRFVLGSVEASFHGAVGAPAVTSDLRPGDSSDMEAVAVEVRRFELVLADSGYLNARAAVDTARTEGGVSLRFRVEPGVRARLLRWRVAGSESLPEARLRRVLPRRRYYTRPRVERAVSAARQAMAEADFPLAEVALVAVAESSGWVTPTLRVIAGPRPGIDFVAFEPELVRRAVLERLARFRKGPYSAERVDAWRRNIESYGFCAVAGVEVVTADADTGLLFGLRRVGASEVFAAAGYSTADSRFNGFARVALGNLFESGRRLSGTWQSGYGDTRYSVSYTEPVALRTPVDVMLEVFHRSVDTSYAHTRGHVRATMLTAGPASVVVETGLERIVDVATRTRVDATWAGTQFGYDRRDRSANPRRGYMVGAGNRLGLRGGDSSAMRLADYVQLDVEAAWPVVGQLVGWARIAVRSVYSAAELLDPELNSMGGANSLRGYGEQQILARSLGWASLEPRVLIGRSTRVYPFFDAGAYGEGDTLRMAAAWGAGARVAAGPGLFGIDYGVALGESPMRGKVHMNLQIGF
ncbi:MAG: BamA/TamA family outer membrane protein [bacterium]